MNNRWNRFLSLLLALCTVLTMIPAAFALETTEELPAETETGEEEVVTAEEPTPVEEPAEQAIAAASADPANVPMAAATLDVPAGTVGADYAVLTYNGTYNHTAAAELLALLNAKLDPVEDRPVYMTELALASAMDMAAESVLGSESARPNGEDWMTIVGDHELTLNVDDYVLGFYSSDSTDEAAALETLVTKYPAIISGVYSYAGIGCFELEGGRTYWAVLLFNGTDKLTTGSDVTSSVDVGIDPALFAGKLRLSVPNSTLGTGDTASTVVSLSTGSDSVLISADQLTFSSSDPTVVTVSSSGVISAVSASGSATVTATLNAAPSLSASVALTSKLNLTAPELKSVANIPTGVQVTWADVPGATHYQIYRTLKSGNWSGAAGNKLVGTVMAGKGSFVDTTAISGTTYYYTVRSIYVAADKTLYMGSGNFDKAGLGIYYLKTPTLSSARAGSEGITFTWQGVTGAAGYTVWRKDTTNTSWKKMATVGSTVSSYVDSGVTKGTRYTYTVRAYYDSYLSSFDHAGKSVTASATATTTSYVVTQKIYYRTGAGKDYSAAGTLNTNASINVISGWSKTVNGDTWYKFNLNGKIYYVMAKYLLQTPVLSSAVNAPTGIKVSWEKVTNATGYTVWRKPKGGSWEKIATIASGNTISYTDTNAILTTGSTYIYTVRAVKGSALSGYNNTGVSCMYVQAPSLTSTSINNGKITVSWKSVSSNASYKVYRKVNGGNWALLGSTTNTYYVDSDITAMNQYTYTVRAVVDTQVSSFNSIGLSAIEIPSGSLTEVAVLKKTSFRTGAGTNYSASGTFNAGVAIQVVTADLNSASTSWCRVLISIGSGDYWRYVAKSDLLLTPALKSAAITANGIQVTWSKVTGATGYAVYRKLPSGSWSQIATISSGSTVSYLDTSVSTGTTYIYTVRAISGSVYSRYSYSGISTTFLAVPSLTGAAASNKGIKITWGKVDGANGYYVYRRPAGGDWVRIKVINSGSTLSYLDDGINGNGQNIGLINGVTYIYTVRAYYTSSVYSYFNTTGVSATATKTLNPVTVKYTVTTNNTTYYTLAADGYIWGGASYEKGTLSKGATVNVITGMPTVKDGYNPNSGVTYTPILLNNSIYYVATSRITQA